MNTDKIISVLSRIGIGQLSEAFGSKRLANLEELGVPMRAKNISKAAFQERGFEIFKNANLRENILNSLSEVQLEKTYGEQSNTPLLSSLAKFQWARNSSTEKFLSIFDVSLENAFPPTKQLAGFFEEINVSKPLFDYQNSIRKQLVSFLSSEDNKRIIAHMPTGSGKTRTTMELISDFIRGRDERDPTLVVWMAHSDELCEQAAQTFLDIWQRFGSENANIYRLWGGRTGDKIDFSKPSFLITSFQSCYAAMVSRDDKKFEIMAQIKSECDLLVVDEAHMSVAPTYKAAIEFLCNQGTQLIGLTATPGRHHIGGEIEGTEQLAEFYESNKITLGNELLGSASPIEFLQSREILSVVERYELPTNIDIELSPKAAQVVLELLELPASFLKELGENAERTTIVAAHALLLAVKQKKQTIVFCPSKENAANMALLLQTKGCNARAITGETPMIERRKSIEDFKNDDIQVLTNFGVLTTGFDAPNIEAVIIARPTTSVVLYSQMIGRGLRGSAVGGSKCCTLVDVVDNIENMPSIPQAFTYFDDFFGDPHADS